MGLGFGNKKIVILGILVGIASYYMLGGQKPKSPIVQLEDGQLQGNLATSRNGKLFYEYLGIPFAKAPVNDLRFEPPAPFGTWNGVRDASKYGNVCLQFDIMAGIFTGEEDCLFLQVFTPKLNPVKPYKVIVFFHGGIFHFGSSNLYRPEYFMDQDVILVTVNYRLGAFGFLNTGTDDIGGIRGNMGLKDQTMALKWVQKNIAKFGGDPKGVVIMGESAGGASSHMHLLSPMSKGLFSKVISQSGTALNPWAIMDTPEIQAKRFASLANCSIDNIKDMVSCLKGLDASKVVGVHEELKNPLREPISIFVPTVDSGPRDSNTFLIEHPRKTLEKGSFTKIPWLAGINSDEGLINSANIMRNPEVLERAEADWEEIFPQVLMMPRAGKDVMSRIREFYFKSQDICSIESIPNYTKMFSDRIFFNGLHSSAILQAKHSPVYLYYYTYPGEFSLLHFLLAVKGKFLKIVELIAHAITAWFNKDILGISPPFYGVCHSDELGLQFYMPWLSKITPQDKDYEMSEKLVKLWVSFVKEDIVSYDGHKWDPVVLKEGKPLTYLHIDYHSRGIIEEPFEERYKFWESLQET